MAIIPNNDQSTLTWLDSFKFTWQTSKQSVIPAFFSSASNFFRGRVVSQKDVDSYLKTQSDMGSDNILTRAINLIGRNISIFQPITEIFSGRRLKLNVSTTNAGNKAEIPDNDSSSAHKENTPKPEAKPEAPALRHRVSSKKVSHDVISPQKKGPLRQIGFVRVGNSCFISTALKSILEGLDENFLTELKTCHKKEKKELKKELAKHTEQEDKWRTISDKLNELRNKDKLIESLKSLASCYFNPSRSGDVNDALMTFLKEIRYYRPPDEYHFFSQIIATTEDGRLTFSPSSATEMLTALLGLNTDENLQSTYTLECQEILKLQQFQEKSGQELLSHTIIKDPKKEITQILLPDFFLGSKVKQNKNNIIKQTIEKRAQPFEEELNPQAMITILKNDQSEKHKEVDINNKNCKSTATHVYSGDLTKLKHLILHLTFIDTTTSSPKIMEELDNNLIISVIHRGKDNNTLYKDGQLYHIELQPQAICLWIYPHISCSVAHFIALTRGQDGLFYVHDDTKVSKSGYRPSQFNKCPVTPEGIICKVISKKLATEFNPPEDNTEPETTQIS